jgi:hypothetical protein
MEDESQNSRRHNAGRKPRYNYKSEAFLSEIESYAKKGFTNKEIALILHLNPTAFCDIKRKYHVIDEVLQRARAGVTAIVRAKFLAMALGGIKTKSVARREIRDTEGNLTGKEEQTTESELAPNLQAQSVWLYHYDDEWKKTERKTDDDSIPKDLEHGIDIDKWINDLIKEK